MQTLDNTAILHWSAELEEMPIEGNVRACILRFDPDGQDLRCCRCTGGSDEAPIDTESGGALLTQTGAMSVAAEHAI